MLAISAILSLLRPRQLALTISLDGVRRTIVSTLMLRSIHLRQFVATLHSWAIAARVKVASNVTYVNVLTTLMMAAVEIETVLCLTLTAQVK